MTARRLPMISAGSWPRRMGANLAAGYVGELSVEAFLERVGTEYPNPRVAEVDDDYGFGTIWMPRFCRRSCGRPQTWQGICDRDPAITPFRCGQTFSERPVGILFLRAG